MSGALTMKAEVKTMAPTDICLIVGPLGVPLPKPFPGESMPMTWAQFVSTVLIESLPALVEGSKQPMCKPHDGPMGAVAGGMPTGMGPLDGALTGAFKVKFGGKTACNKGAMFAHNSKNSPPLVKVSSQSTKVKIS